MPGSSVVNYLPLGSGVTFPPVVVTVARVRLRLRGAMGRPFRAHDS
jgi:hypothetical protein